MQYFGILRKLLIIIEANLTQRLESHFLRGAPHILRLASQILRPTSNMADLAVPLLVSRSCLRMHFLAPWQWERTQVFVTALFSIDSACANPGKGKQFSHKVIAEENPKTTSKQIDLGLPEVANNLFAKKTFSLVMSTQGRNQTFPCWRLSFHWNIGNWCFCTRVDLGSVAFRWADVITCQLTPGFLMRASQSWINWNFNEKTPLEQSCCFRAAEWLAKYCQLTVEYWTEYWQLTGKYLI